MSSVGKFLGGIASKLGFSSEDECSQVQKHGEDPKVEVKGGFFSALKDFMSNPTEKISSLFQKDDTPRND